MRWTSASSRQRVGTWLPRFTAASFATICIFGRYLLSRENDNASRTAGVLGLSRVMLHKKLRTYGIR